MIRKLLGIMHFIKVQRIFLLEKWYLLKYQRSLPGTTAWLVGTEIKYGGFIKNVPRNKVSSQDPRTKIKIATGGMTGGDRMLHNGYAKTYEKYLKPYILKENILLVEVGILKGTGIAIWSELFKTGRIIGLDIDLSHTHGNMDSLKSRGAFTIKEPELYEYDQFKDNTEMLGDILKGNKIDIFIDDGFHSVESIISTLKSVLPYMSDEFLYFIEDNKFVHKEITALYPDLLIDNVGRLTVVTRKRGCDAHTRDISRESADPPINR